MVKLIQRVVIQSSIKNIMNDFLYTFSSKQFDAQMGHKGSQNACQSLHESANKKQLSGKSIRSKKLKRYQKFIEPKGIRKHITEPENEFMGLENIASQTLVRMSEYSPHKMPRSIRTIQQSNKHAFVKDIRLTDCIKHPKKCELLPRNNHFRAPQTHNIGQGSQNKKQGDRQRCLSLKDAPLVHYPSDQRKLPKAFRCKSIHQESGTRQNKIKDVRLQIFSSKTPKAVVQPTLHNLSPQMVKVGRSTSRLFSSQMNRKMDKSVQCQNGEEINHFSPTFGDY